jgi:hypothetical protein
MIQAYEDWLEDTDDPEVAELIAEIVTSDYSPQDLVDEEIADIFIEQ